MTVAALKLTTYLGERDRAGGRLLAEVLADRYAAHDVRASCVVRGIEGFGAAHRMQTDRLLTPSETLPLVSTAVDTRERIERVHADVLALQPTGLVTVERARLLDGLLPPSELTAEAADGDRIKLTLYVGRQALAGGRPAHLAAVDALHAADVEGATVLLGVDGTLRGARERARLLSRNRAVPLMVIATGSAERIATALPHLQTLLPRPLATVERVRLCKRDGVVLGPPHSAWEAAAAGTGLWQKLTVYASEQSRHDGAPLHDAIVRALHDAGAAGATAVRGIWGYHGDHAPYGDRFLAIRRRVPVLTVAIDRPERCARWFEVIDALTADGGLVTSELVRAARGGGAAARPLPPLS